VRTVLRIAAIAYIVYLALALLVITPALNVLPHRYINDTYGWQLRTGWVLLNPFKLSLDIREAELTDPAGEPVAAFDDATVNLSLESLWHPGWVLDTVSFQNIFLGITRLNDTEYNFSSLLPDSEASPEAEEEPTGIPAVTIHELDLHSESIAVSDRARTKVYSSRWDGLHIRASEFSTLAEEGRPYTVDLQGDGGGTLHWEGEVSLVRGNSAGSLTVDNLSLRKLWEFAEPWLAFELKQGRLELRGNYRLDWSDDFSYHIEDGHVGISGIDIVPGQPAQLPDTALQLALLGVDGIDLDSKSQQIKIVEVNVDGLGLASWMEGSQVSLAQMFVPGDETPEDSDATAGKSEVKSKDNGWSVTLGKARIVNSNLRWRSAYTDPAFLDIQPIEVSVDNFSWPFSGDTGLALKVAVNEQANLEVGGALQLDAGAGTLKYALKGLPLTWFNPNLPKALKVTMTGGEAEATGQVVLQEFYPASVALTGGVRDFSANQEGEELVFTSFKWVRLEGLAVDMQEHTLDLERAVIDEYHGRIHIHKDGSVNASRIWKEEVGEQAEQIAEDLTQDKPWTFNIPTIAITDSEIDFMDENLPIQFRTVIGGLEGEVLDISSAAATAASVDIEGSVDGYAPVALKGNVSPFADPLALNLNLTFNNVDMALLTPYSGTYAGYAIDRGLLNLDLQYKLEDNRLQGKNAIRIDKLRLGEKIESDKAVDLPLELALAILTDANGVIDMQVPVSGDVSKPDFELGSVISKAVMNIITKVITSPFTLLAGLADSEEDLQRLGFGSGRATLSERNRHKLDSLAEALAQRPKLSLVITGRVNFDKDRARLQKDALKAMLLEDGLSGEEIEAEGEDWEDAIADRYEDLPAANEGATIREQYVSVYKAIEIPDDALSALAKERAANVKSYLVNDAGLAADRAVVDQSGLKKGDNTFGGVELEVES